MSYEKKIPRKCRSRLALLMVRTISTQISKETKRHIDESAKKQPASKPNHNIQQTVLFGCGILPSSHTATGGAGGLVFPPNNANTHTSELTQSMQQAPMAQPPSPTNTVRVFANESSVDAAAASEAAAIYTFTLSTRLCSAQEG